MGGPGMGHGPRSGLAAKLAMEKAQKEAVSAHKTGLPDKLLRLFQPRPPLRLIKPKRKRGAARVPMGGLAQYVTDFAGPGDPEFEPPPKRTDLREPRILRNPELVLQARIEDETKPEKVLRQRQQRSEEAKAKIEEAVAEWDPAKDPKAEGDPFKTLFVARLSYETTERKLRREFEEFGPVKRVRIVADQTGKPRGYAFIEYEHKNDMKAAYKLADGRRIDDRRVLVDVERGRTVPNWKPRRLAGGKGGEARLPREPKNFKKKQMARVLEMALRGERVRDEREVPLDREHEKEREHDRERAREREARRMRDERERVVVRGDRDRERERGSRVERPKERERRRSRSRSKDRRRDKSRERKRERDIEDDRSGKRPREDGERERDA